jgi:hypothetical protein
MPFMKHIYTSLFLLLSAPALLHADYVTISGADGFYDLFAGDFGGMLANDDNQFSLTEQEILAATLNNDGIETAGKLSFILASTDAGLSFIGLFDGIPFADPYGELSNHYLGVSTTTSTGADWFASGDTGSDIGWNDIGNGSQVLNALLGWNHENTSAGFAWGDIQSAPTGTVNLYDVSLTEFGNDSIQFLTYQDDHWTVAGSGDFSVLGQYAFSYQLVPAPGAFALLAIAGLVGTRRRRN